VAHGYPTLARRSAGSGARAGGRVAVRCGGRAARLLQRRRASPPRRRPPSNDGAERFGAAVGRRAAGAALVLPLSRFLDVKGFSYTARPWSRARGAARHRSRRFGAGRLGGHARWTPLLAGTNAVLAWWARGRAEVRSCAERRHWSALSPLLALVGRSAPAPLPRRQRSASPWSHPCMLFLHAGRALKARRGGGGALAHALPPPRSPQRRPVTLAALTGRRRARGRPFGAAATRLMI